MIDINSIIKTSEIGEEFLHLKIGYQQDKKLQKATKKALEVFIEETLSNRDGYHLRELGLELNKKYGIIQPDPITTGPLLTKEVRVNKVFPYLSTDAQEIYYQRFPNTVLELYQNKETKEVYYPFENQETYNNLSGFHRFPRSKKYERISVLCQYLSFKITYEDKLDLDYYTELLSKLFSKLVEKQILGYGIFSPISYFKSEQYFLSPQQTVNSYTEKRKKAKDDFLKDLELTEQKEHTQKAVFLYMFVFPSLETSEKIREVGDMVDNLNKLVGINIFSSEGKQVENTGIWDEIKKYVEDADI